MAEYLLTPITGAPCITGKDDGELFFFGNRGGVRPYIPLKLEPRVQVPGPAAPRTGGVGRQLHLGKVGWGGEEGHAILACIQGKCAARRGLSENLCLVECGGTCWNGG